MTAAGPRGGGKETPGGGGMNSTREIQSWQNYSNSLPVPQEGAQGSSESLRVVPEHLSTFGEGKGPGWGPGAGRRLNAQAHGWELHAGCNTHLGSPGTCGTGCRGQWRWLGSPGPPPLSAGESGCSSNPAPPSSSPRPEEGEVLPGASPQPGPRGGGGAPAEPPLPARRGPLPPTHPLQRARPPAEQALRPEPA